jgi:hypothetical protein
MRSRLRSDGSVEEVSPERCPAGHPLLPHGTLVGWSPCDCTPGVHGHRTYTCRFLVDSASAGWCSASRRASTRMQGRCRGLSGTGRSPDVRRRGQPIEESSLALSG